MKNKTFKSALIAFAFVTALVLAGTLSSFTAKSITPYTNDNKDGQWKNLKVLPQDITKDSLIGLMKGYNKALGVKCIYCHVPKRKDEIDFVSDAKQEKEYARHMITMTRQINAEHFNWENSAQPEKIDHVKCVTCHYGNPKPTEHLKNIGSFYQDEE